MIKFNSKKFGAELTSIKYNDVEKLYDGLSLWNRQSPILFPIVGMLRDNKTNIDEKEYNMNQHGFARDMEFEELIYNDKVQKYRLKSSEITKTKYPYEFELYIEYIATEDSVTTKYTVLNTDSRDVVFGIGGHPAFNINYCDAYLEFENEEKDISFLELKDGLIYKEYNRILEKAKLLKMNSNFFEKDAVIMKNIKSKKIFVKNQKTNETILEFVFENFKYLALWSKSDSEFLCIEPWQTTADYSDSNFEFKDKKDNIVIERGKQFVCEYKVIFK